jgi:hypothetical protein
MQSFLKRGEIKELILEDHPSKDNFQNFLTPDEKYNYV